jgi:hypothetical protein
MLLLIKDLITKFYFFYTNFISLLFLLITKNPKLNSRCSDRLRATDDAYNSSLTNNHIENASRWKAQYKNLKDETIAVWFKDPVRTAQ